MESLERSAEDGLSRVAIVLTLSPIGVAASLMMAGALLGSGASEQAAPILGLSAAVLIVAAGFALYLLDRVVVRDLRRLLAFLRAARHGLEIRAPRGVGGVLGEILEAAEDIVQNQNQMSRAITHLQSVQQLRESIERTATESKSQAVLVSRAVLQLAEELKIQAKSQRDDWAAAFAEQVEAGDSRIFAERRAATELKSDVEAVRRAVHGVGEEARTLDASVKALGGEIRASALSARETVPGLIETHGAAKDRRPDRILDRLQKLELVLVEKFNVLANPGASPAKDIFQEQASLAFGDLRAAIDEGFASMSMRVDVAADRLLFRGWELGASDHGQKWDRIEAGMAAIVSGLRSSTASLPERIVEIEEMYRRIAAALEDIKQIETVGARDLPSLFARLELLVAKIDDLAGQAPSAPAMLADLGVALADQAAVGAAQATAMETLARGVENALGIARKGRFSDEVAEAVVSSARNLETVASQLVALGRASHLHQEASASLLTELAALRDRKTTEDEGRAESLMIAMKLEALESKVAAACESSCATLTEIAALPSALAHHIRLLDVAPRPVDPTDAGLSNDPPASASELSAAVELLHRDLGALAGRVEEAMISMGRADFEDEARAGAGRLLEAVLSIHTLVGPLDASSLHGPLTPKSRKAESLASLFAHTNRRLDQLIDRVEHFIDQERFASHLPTAPAPESSVTPYFHAISNQIEEIAARLDDFAARLDTLASGQSRIEPIFKQVFAPLQDRIVAAAEVNALGFGRLAGQFGQLAIAVSMTPKSILGEARNLFTASQVDLSPLQLGIDDLRGDMKDLAASFTRIDLDGSSKGQGADPVAIIDLSNYLRAEMDAVHGRLDHFAARIDQIVDLLDEAAPTLSDAHDLHRGDDPISAKVRDAFPEFAPMTQRIEAASAACVESLREWRVSTVPWSPESFEAILRGLLAGFSRTLAADFNALQRDGLEFRQMLSGSITNIHAGLEDLHGRIDGLVKGGEANSNEPLSAVVTLSARLDRVLTAVDRLGADLKTTLQMRERASASLEASSEASVATRLGQFQETIAETLLTLESRWEQPLIEFRQSVASMTQFMTVGASAPAKRDESASRGEPADHRSLLAAALKTMSEFMNVIDKRYVALKTMAEVVKAGGRGGAEADNSAAFGEQLDEMFRLTGEFLDISCAISDDLDERAKAA